MKYKKIFNILFKSSILEKIDKTLSGHNQSTSSESSFRRLLFMDDETTLHNIVQMMMRRLDITMDSAYNGEEAIDLYQKALDEENKYSLVILDLSVPDGKGGEEVISELQRMDPEVQAVVSSGDSDNPIIKNHKDFGFVDSLCKPFGMSELMDIINKYVP